MPGPAFDAASNVGGGIANLSWTHTPVGTPKGILVLITQNVGVTDEVTGVTYGGVAMAEVSPDSPFLHTLGAEDGSLYAYFLGSGIPTGAQTVAVTVNGTGSSKRAVAVSVTAAGDTSIEDAVTSEDSTGLTHSATLVTGAGVATFVAAAMQTGALTTSLDPGADYTQILEHSFGAQSASWTRRTSNPTGGNVTVDWTSVGNEESGIIAVAIREVPSGTGTASAKATATASGEKAASGSASCSAKPTVTATAASSAASGSASCSAKATVAASGSPGPPSSTTSVAMII